MAGTFTNLIYHLVFSTKERKPLIAADLQEDLYSYIGGIIRGEGGVLLEIGGVPDHVHILTKLKPYPSVSDMLRCIKGNSSKWLNEEQERFRIRKFAWQEGYAAFSVSESQVPRVVKYIRGQEKHHKRRDFKTELIALLEKHRVEYDERYLWDGICGIECGAFRDRCSGRIAFRCRNRATWVNPQPAVAPPGLHPSRRPSTGG